jgi:hypothetical protein
MEVYRYKTTQALESSSIFILFIMWSSAEITKASSEEITEFLTAQQAVLTESYTGPDAQALDRSIVVVCGRDAPEGELLLLRYQAFRIWSATKSRALSTLGTYLNCLQTGWVACIDARNSKPENINDPWDYVAHPMEKVTTILCEHIAPKLIANKAQRGQQDATSQGLALCRCCKWLLM